MIRTLGCLPALIRPPFRCSTVPLQARARNGTTTATLRVIYPATNLGPGRATQHGQPAKVIGERAVDLDVERNVLGQCCSWVPNAVVSIESESNTRPISRQTTTRDRERRPPVPRTERAEHGKPVARLVPLESDVETERRILQRLRAGDGAVLVDEATLLGWLPLPRDHVYCYRIARDNPSGADCRRALSPHGTR